MSADESINVDSDAEVISDDGIDNFGWRERHIKLKGEARWDIMRVIRDIEHWSCTITYSW